MPDKSANGKLLQKIFVNRSLNMGEIKAIGFDMDHTLAIYNSIKFEELAFEETLKKFIEAGYPAELKKLKFDHDFVIRGLMVDCERGNILKVDGHKYVKVAYHGHKKLEKEERRRIYNQESFRAENFVSIDTLFALSEVQLFIEIVDYMNTNPGQIKKSYAEVYKDLRLFIDTAHRDGSIKSKVLANIEDFIQKDKYLSQTLIKLIDDGKKIFLLTNSQWDYTKEIMTYLLNDENEEFPHWRDYFSHVIVGASKPNFFTGRQPFFEVNLENELLSPNPPTLEEGKVYHGGNAYSFQRSTNLAGDEILYVGDHIFGDIMKSKGTLNWRTMLIMDELEEELPKVEELKPELDVIYQAIEQLESIESDAQRMRSTYKNNERKLVKASESGDDKKEHYLKLENSKLAEQIQETQQKFDEKTKNVKKLIRERESKFHPIWGEIMKVGLQRSRFANQVKQFACIYTCRVSNLRFYNTRKRYVSHYEILPHDK